MKHRNYTPRIFPHDSLATMPDHELERIQTSLSRRMRDHRGPSRRALEVELCYVHREREIREMRKKAHAEYLTTIPNYRRGRRA